MKSVKRITPLRIVALIFSVLIPLAAIAFGILMLIRDFIPNACLLITFIFLPVSVIVGNFFLITSKMKTWLKSILCISLIIVFTVVALPVSAIGYFEQIKSYKNDEAVEKYSAVVGNDSLMPKLDKIKQPESMEYHSYFSTFFVYFTCESNTLICRYNEQDYTEQKKLLEEQYVFEQEKILIDSSNCDPVVLIDDYTFRFLSIDEYDIYFPQHVYLVATNDITHEIVYISYYDIDHDYVSSAEEFINTDCGWEHIR